MNTYSRREDNEVKLFFYGFQRRDNSILQFIVGFFHFFSHYPSLIIEAFFRKKFGERYFTLSSSIVLFLVLLLISMAPEFLRMIPVPRDWRIDQDFDFLLFAFAFAFLFKSILHRREISKYGTTYNLDRFSLSQGEFHPFFMKRWNSKFLGLPVNAQTVQIIFEPLVAIIIGMIFFTIPFSRTFGLVIFLSGITMMMRQFARAMSGRNAVLDIIDQNIISTSKADVLFEKKPMFETKGLSIPVALPEENDVREMIIEETMVDDEPLSRDTWENNLVDESKEGA